jgi:hypothetical protein
MVSVVGTLRIGPLGDAPDTAPDCGYPYPPLKLLTDGGDYRVYRVHDANGDCVGVYVDTHDTGPEDEHMTQGDAEMRAFAMPDTFSFRFEEAQRALKTAEAEIQRRLTALIERS